MIQTIIMTLGLKVIFSENPRIECMTNANIGGCRMGRLIVLGYDYPDINEALYHEVGHAMFQDDEEVKACIVKYPAPRNYQDSIYPTDENKLDERMADYAAMYFKYPDFPEKFPEVKELFDRKVASIIK